MLIRSQFGALKPLRRQYKSADCLSMSVAYTTDLLPYFQECRRVCTDTRKLRAGDLFVALKGANFDGNAFAARALEQGAAFAVVDNPEVVEGERFLLVQDGLQALQNLATAYRRTFDIPFLAITGSNGKTTTKELIAAVLGEAHRTHFTQGNFNNHIGVPLTLLAMPADTEIAVIEMGANHQGEIAELCKIAEPTHGLITNVGLAHLEGFGGFGGVKKGKSEMYAYLAEAGGVVFINLDEPHLAELADQRGAQRRIAYHLTSHPDISHPNFEIKPLAISPRIQVAFLDKVGQQFKADSSLSGKHNLQNIITAVAVGKYFKVPAESIVWAIEGYKPENNRSQWLEQGGTRYYLDAYNANPTSMRVSVQNFAGLDGGPKWAILGDMLELGEEAAQEHLAVAQYCQGLGLDHLILVGPLFAAAANKLNLPHFMDGEALGNSKYSTEWTGNLVLIKGSRGMRLESLVAEIS
ncbi:MAG: UDP-N-acetylmuramoyl-tripeptide--D-alanyl-D-alanine ligase [Bacteroidota bacterium]